MQESYYSSLVEQLIDRSAESTLGVLSVSPAVLRSFLAEHFRASPGDPSALLSSPVFESTFPWEAHDRCIEELIDNPLHPSLVEAMSNPPADLASEAFPKDRYPYRHQVRAWELLSQEQVKSTVITTGTGSGKTECFMVPILNDMAKEYASTGKPLVGVRSLFIYPLNALISSQRDRLRAWTHHYGGNIRFCLYNGLTKETMEAKRQQEAPNEILSRKLLRQSPPPLLITNATMLEYMLIRTIDQPILQQSQGKLRWIVLDEAHSYIGSQAAELSLLLRRVMHAFNVNPKDIRFVAISATIGGDEEAQSNLKKYLAGLGGISEEQVEVVGGEREKPSLPDAEKKTSLDLQSITSITNENERYHALTANQTARKIRGELIENKALDVNQLARKVYGEASEKNAQDCIDWLDLCSRTSLTIPDKKDHEPFLPIRGHLFHRVVHGLWACVDPDCNKKTETALDHASWHFGYVYTHCRLKCDCGAPVYEIVFCNDCNTVYLHANERDGKILQSPKQEVDEFSLDIEEAIDDTEDGDAVLNTPGNPVILAPQRTDATLPMKLLKEDMTLDGEDADGIAINYLVGADLSCTACGYKGYGKWPIFRHAYLGTPFYVSNIAYTLLEYCRDAEKEPASRPSRGRRLITFTDSRQGTARIAAKIQQDSERNRIRGLVYEFVAKSGSSEKDAGERKKELEDTLKIPNLPPHAKSTIEKELSQLEKPTNLSWNELVEKLQEHDDISKYMLDYYKDINPALFLDTGGVRTLAQILLLREFGRRPRRQNSLETLGLVAIQYPGMENVKKLPQEWEAKGKSLDDWRDFLKICLDFYVRDGIFINIPHDWLNWMGARFFTKSLLPPGSSDTGKQHKAWPQLQGNRKPVRLFRLLSSVLSIDLKNKEGQDILNALMRAAWEALTREAKVLTAYGGTAYRLERDKLAFSPIREAWHCPVTLRVLDTTLCGVTPYLPEKSSAKDNYCSKIVMPSCPEVHADSERERLYQIREWLKMDKAVQALREEGIWSDLSDRIVEGGMFFRAAEHSAQQPSGRLLDYERKFKDGRLNVLSCSTTMEMGVDIGGLSIVAMNNVPPHPANYLQRAGRAGRRGETRSVALTVCRDNPHEQAVFGNPTWAFTTAMPKPIITLSSERIVQRHINAFVLTHFLQQKLPAMDIEATKLNCGWFFCSEDSQDSIVNKARAWLHEMEENIEQDMKDGISSLVIGRVLSTAACEKLIQRCREMLEAAQESWLDEYLKLQEEWGQANNAKDSDPYKRRIQKDIERAQKEYLISELATRGFLPSYGFPTNIAQFDPYTVHDYQKNKSTERMREDNFSRIREKPGRNLSMAIREYAPGADIVLNGLVYKSEGLSLNWHIPQGESDIVETQKFRMAWRCGQCGSSGSVAGSSDDLHCDDCGEMIKPEYKKEFIQPAGFATSFYSSPTNDISSQHFIPAHEPWVNAKGEFKPLPNPATGVFRCSTDGHIFYHSTGEHGAGYSLCLECGRAESMGKDGAIPKMADQHPRLRGKVNANPDKSDSIKCEGPNKGFMIKHNLCLGYEDSTDVFELYLKNPASGLYITKTKENLSLSWTLAVAIREALASADYLGINAEELGFLVKPVQIPAAKGQEVLAICVYDTCGGGAGFSSTAPEFLGDLLCKARQHLECPVKCNSACQFCLLGYDTRDKIDLLDRHIALDFLSDNYLYAI